MYYIHLLLVGEVRAVQLNLHEISLKRELYLQLPVPFKLWLSDQFTVAPNCSECGYLASLVEITIKVVNS